MTSFDAVTLARLQFALNIGFHILFPAITIGLAWLLLYFRIRFTRTGNVAWEYAYYFWVRIFALTFAVGVVSGVTMSFQFGTNWPGFIERAGNITGPLLGYEVLTAFFIEATFLAIMLFGKERVSNRVHLTSAALVALGTTLSAFWILSLNSWMQTPQGYEIADGRFFAADWLAVIFNPSFPYRLAHMLVASLLTSSFLIAGVSASRVVRGVDGPATALVLRTGVRLAAVLAPLQLVIGDLHGLNTLAHQPAKIAAIEALWQSGPGAPFTVLGWPDEGQGRTRFALEIPRAASLVLTHDPDGAVQGLDAFPGAHPPVAPLFFAFRIMVGLGLAMIAVAWYLAWAGRGGRSLPRSGLRVLSWMTFSGWVATLAGWVVTEMGRQPWLVYGLLRTAEVAAPHPPATIALTLTAYALLYACLLVAYVLTLRHLGTKPAASLRMLGQPAPGGRSP
ncbi:MAG TPA: cytochrome ubiquinol oxidase subunit I [Gammaproteobacteria bacterium]|jgi:cytochrome d ubiquinol oxidase subunit I|nr:cytochrome ubiquinol oxidase subunit I [Gammaproteobacteria bacterium]